MLFNEKSSNFEENNIPTLLSQLRSFNDQLDGTFDVSDVINNLEKAADAARKKQYEMEVLAFFAFFSDHETISEQRKQLFFTTKMVYDDRIKDLLSYYESSHQSGAQPMATSAVSRSFENKKNTGMIADLWERWTNSFRKIRKVKRINNV